MDIHKPKAAHSFREFLIEIGTIILGILIALGLEQLAEHQHWQAAVKEARAAIHEEIAFNGAFLQARATMQPCVDKRLTDIDQALTAGEASGRVAAVPGSAIGLSAQISDAQWQAARAAQTLAHFPHDELEALGRYYDTINTFKTTFMPLEGENWRWLSDLDRGPHQYAPSDLFVLRQHLRSAKTYNRVIAAAGQRLVDENAKLGVKPAVRDFKDFAKICADTPA